MSRLEAADAIEIEAEWLHDHGFPIIARSVRRALAVLTAEPARPEPMATAWGEVPTDKAPEVPAEFWLLRMSEGGYVEPIDEPRGATNYLVCFTEGDAILAAKHQNDLYDMDCVPVCVYRRDA